jgi:hypothetical protein
LAVSPALITGALEACTGHDKIFNIVTQLVIAGTATVQGVVAFIGIFYECITTVAEEAVITITTSECVRSTLAI